MLFNGMETGKISRCCGGIKTPIQHVVVLQADVSQHPKQHSDRFNHFCRVIVVTNTQTALGIVCL